jgi:hypothetical protein
MLMIVCCRFIIRMMRLRMRMGMIVDGIAVGMPVGMNNHFPGPPASYTVSATDFSNAFALRTGLSHNDSPLCF